MNDLNVIYPYNINGSWVFDDEAKGLNREPFVGGTDCIIDKATKGLQMPGLKFKMLFSMIPFPNHQYCLDWVREGEGGNYYFSSDFNQEGWLCPSLLRYFETPPSKIYVQIKEIH